MNESKLAVIKRSYEVNNQTHAKNEFDYFRNMSNIFEVIEYAALAKDDRGKRLSHQRRLQKSVLKIVFEKLVAKTNELQNSKSFEEILGIVDSCRVKGFGDLAVYDTSLRIGVWLKKEPEYVYLHAGTKKGAKAKILGLKTRGRKYIKMEEIPYPLNQLSPMQVEDILCIYKDQLLAMQ